MLLNLPFCRDSGVLELTTHEPRKKAGTPSHHGYLSTLLRKKVKVSVLHTVPV